MARATVNVLPDPVTPSRVWANRPFRKPCTILSQAWAWSPAGKNGAASSNGRLTGAPPRAAGDSTVPPPAGCVSASARLTARSASASRQTRISVPRSLSLTRFSRAACVAHSRLQRSRSRSAEGASAASGLQNPLAQPLRSPRQHPAGRHQPGHQHHEQHQHHGRASPGHRAQPRRRPGSGCVSECRLHGATLARPGPPLHPPRPQAQTQAQGSQAQGSNCSSAQGSRLTSSRRLSSRLKAQAPQGSPSRLRAEGVQAQVAEAQGTRSPLRPSLVCGARGTEP